jgi:hypothetical protein
MASQPPTRDLAPAAGFAACTGGVGRGAGAGAAALALTVLRLFLVIAGAGALLFGGATLFGTAAVERGG